LTVRRGQTYEVVAHDLVTGQERVLCGEAKEDIKCITLSENLLGFASTDGVLYVADLRIHDPPLRFQVPSAQVTALTSDGDTIALLAGSSTIAVFSSSTKKLETYSFAQQVGTVLNSTLTPTNILLSVRHGTVDVFSNGIGSEGPGAEWYHRSTPPSIIHFIGHMRFNLWSCRRPEHKPLKCTISSVLELYTESR